MRAATVAVHSGQPEGENTPVSNAIHVSSTYTWPSYSADDPRYIYSRYTNPNREAMENSVAALEGAHFGAGFGSGMAAIMAVLELAKAGEHVLIAEDIYGGTFNLGKDILPRHGVEVGSFNSLDPSTVAFNAQGNTKLLIFESPTNPNLRIADIRAIAAEAHRLGILVAFDNTFATPVLQHPLAHGADVVVHSCTKYMGGHSDLVGGVAVTSNEEIYNHLHHYAKVAGGIPGPFDSWLVCRGIKSLVARMRMHCDNAMRVAEFLDGHARVRKVHFPGLRSHPGHELAQRQMAGFGAMLSFEIDGTPQQAMDFGVKCKLVTQAASLGGVESLISYPPKLSHAGMTEEQRLERGIPPTMLRLSVGLEDAEDLIEDLDQALNAL